MEIIKILAIPLDKLKICMIPFLAIGVIHEIKEIPNNRYILMFYFIAIVSLIFIILAVVDKLLIEGPILIIPNYLKFIVVLGVSLMGYAIYGVLNIFGIVSVPALDLNIFFYLGILGYGQYLLWKIA